MVYYIISLLTTLALIHIVITHIPRHNFLILLITIVGVSLLLILFVEIFVEPDTVFFNSVSFNKAVAIVEGDEFAQTVYGALVAALLYYWFSTNAFARIEIVGAAAAVVMFGFLLPTVGRWPMTITEVSLPFGRVAFEERSSAMTVGPVVTSDRSEKIFGKDIQSASAAIALFSGLANPEPGKGHVNRDKVYAGVERGSDLEERMNDINGFIADVFQPLAACSERIRREMNSNYLFKDELLEVAAALRIALAHTEPPHDDVAWKNFRTVYTKAELDVLREIGRHDVALESDDIDTPTSACRLVLAVLKYPDNPFREPTDGPILPYGPLVLALLLHAAGETDAAIYELARWLDGREKSGTAFPANPKYQWFELRAKLYLADLLKEAGPVPQVIQNVYGKIRDDFEELFTFIPHTKASLKERMGKCREMPEHEIDLLFAFITITNAKLESAVGASGFDLKVEDIEKAWQDADYLSAVRFDCFNSISDRETLKMFEAAIYVTLGEAYLALADTDKMKDRIGNRQYERWLEQAETQLQKAVPILSEAKAAPTPEPGSWFTSTLDRTKLHPARDATARYEKATQWLLEIRRYTRQN